MAAPKTVSSAMLSIPVLYLREGRAYIAYTPTLDVSASGTTVARAEKNFETTLRRFLDELIARTGSPVAASGGGRARIEGAVSLSRCGLNAEVEPRAVGTVRAIPAAGRMRARAMRGIASRVLEGMPEPAGGSASERSGAGIHHPQ